MKKPVVPWTCGCVEQELGPPRMAELRPLIAERLDRGARTRRRCPRSPPRRSCRRSRRSCPPGFTRSAATRSSSAWSSGSGRARQRRSGRPASTPRPEQGASTRTRSKPVSLCAAAPSRPRSRPDVVGAEHAAVLLELAGAARVQLDRDDVALELCRLAARSGAEVERALARSRSRRRRPASCEPRLCGQIRPAATASSSTRSTWSASGRSGSGATLDLAGLAAVEPDNAFRRLVLRAHERERVLRGRARSHHSSATQSG